MTQKPKNTSERFNTPGPTSDIEESRSQNLSSLSNDQDFETLRMAYQNANFERCGEIMDRLDARDPDHPTLQKYREEVELRQTVKTMAHSKNSIEKKQNKTRSLRLGLFAIAATLFVMISLIFSYFYINTKVSARQIQEETSQLAELEEQVEHLLIVGKPRPAYEVLERMRTINPEYEELPELEANTYDLLILENKYQTALDLLNAGQNQEALVLFREIENEIPGLWDVQLQIENLENQK